MRSKLWKSLAELGLIFVGITLALAFENWNAERLDRIQESDLLSALTLDLNQSLDDLRRDIASAQKGLDDLGLIVAWQDGEELSDSSLFRVLGSMGSASMLFPNVSAYESLKTIGLDLISDADLRGAVTSLHELTLVRAKGFERRRDELHVDVVQPFLRHNLRYDGEAGVVQSDRQMGRQVQAPLDRLRPGSVPQLRANSEFRIIARERFNAESSTLLGYRSLEAEIVQLLHLLRLKSADRTLGGAP